MSDHVSDPTYMSSVHALVLLLNQILADDPRKAKDFTAACYEVFVNLLAGAPDDKVDIVIDGIKTDIKKIREVRASSKENDDYAEEDSPPTLN